MKPSNQNEDGSDTNLQIKSVLAPFHLELHATLENPADLVGPEIENQRLYFLTWNQWNNSRTAFCRLLYDEKIAIRRTLKQFKSRPLFHEFIWHRESSLIYLCIAAKIFF